MSSSRAIIWKRSSPASPPFRCLRAAAIKFFYKIVEAQLTFERNADKKVTAVVLHQNGRDMRAPRADTPQ